MQHALPLLHLWIVNPQLSVLQRGDCIVKWVPQLMFFHWTFLTFEIMHTAATLSWWQTIFLIHTFLYEPIFRKYRSKRVSVHQALPSTSGLPALSCRRQLTSRWLIYSMIGLFPACLFSTDFSPLCLLPVGLFPARSFPR